MPPRAPPKAYQLLLKTHQLTIFVTVPQTSTIAAVKEEALSALTSEVVVASSVPQIPHIPTAPGEDDVMLDGEESVGGEELPRVETTSDFELCRAVKDKGKSTSTSASVTYEVLDAKTPIHGLLSNWEVLYVQFKDDAGNLIPVEVSQPSLLDDEEDDPRTRVPSNDESPVAVGKGKRKAPPE